MWRTILVVATLLAVAGCGGGKPSSSGLATSTPSSPQHGTPPLSSAAAESGQPAFSFGAGVPVSDLADSGDLLGPADFAAVGLAAADAYTENPSGNANYIVYAGISGAGGGIELDIFLLGSPAEAATDFGGVAMYALDPAVVQGIGADQAGYYPDQPGNDAGTTYSEIRVLKGKAWFDLSLPSGPQAQAQLVALATLVVARGAGLFG